MERQRFGIRFRKFERIALLPQQEGKLPFKQDDFIVVDTNRGFECGQVVSLAPGSEKRHPFEIIVNKFKRVATPEDLAKLRELEEKEKEYLKLCNRKIEEYKLPIKIVGVELLFDGYKVFFHYRKIDENEHKKQAVNIRPLLQDLNKELQLKVEIREVGMRGEAKIIGGLGECGKTLCCANWLHRSRPITVKMAKEQGLAININKLSGVCGRLKCCLQYEKECYHEGRIADQPHPEKKADELEDFNKIFKEE